MSTPAIRLQSERLRYPAMQVDEILVWRNWLKLHELEYDRFDYNVRIGTGQDPGDAFQQNIRSMAIMLTQLRLDAVAYKNDMPTIFEVKRRAGPQNVGQLLTYFHVAIGSGVLKGTLKLVLVCADFSPNILPVVKASNITLDVVPTVFTSLAPVRPGRPAT